MTTATQPTNGYQLYDPQGKPVGTPVVAEYTGWRQIFGRPFNYAELQPKINIGWKLVPVNDPSLEGYSNSAVIEIPEAVPHIMCINR